MKNFAVIPARYGSTRFPGKPLVDIAGKPMIRWVWEAAVSAKKIDRVVIATDDERIIATVKSFGAEAILTPAELACGTDRVASVIRGIYPSDRPDIVVNIQGDEPLLTGEILDKLVEGFIKSDAPMGTVVAPATESELADPNTVKAICDGDNNALDFTRERRAERGVQSAKCEVPPPTTREAEGKTNNEQRPATTNFKHIGIYIFKTHALLDFAQLKPTPREKAEKLEQLRALENGWKIYCADIPEAAGLIGVDTEEDLEKVKGKMIM